MEWQSYVAAAVFALLGAGCVAVIPVGLPGTWLMIGLAALFEWMDGSILPGLAGAEPVTFGWPLLLGCGVVGLAGEALEFAAGALGTRYGGGTRQGMWGAVVGGLLGGVLGTALLPIPLIGTLVGALIGTFVGAWAGERRAVDATGHARSFKAAVGATLGRLAGTVGKTVLALLIWLVLVVAAFSP
jgi:uncharacterized protein YqgC (DUF456 family)